jgi:DNA-binding transcriptional LysR family regulator
MRTGEFSELRAFVAVAERLNFARAAADLGLVPSSISQLIRDLEERAGARLFNRTTRKVSLTDAGKKLIARVRPAIVELGAAIEELDEFRDTPTGTLRLSITSIASQVVLAPVLSTFHALYPSITLDITVSDEKSDFVGGRFDAGIRAGRFIAKDMKVIRVSPSSRLIAVAASSYLLNHAPPVTPADLQQHQCIRFRNDDRIFEWEFSNGKRKFEVAVNGPLVVNSMELMVRAALEGIGIGYTIESYVAPQISQGRLIPLLKDWSTLHHSYYLYYSDRGQLPVPLKALIDFFGNA